MLNWNYNHQDYLNGGFEPIPPGPHRVRIDNAEEAVSKSGKDMIKLTLDVSGYSGKVFYYMVFVPEYPEQTNKRLGDIYESFGIPQGDLEPLLWIGKVGAAMLSTEVYEGKEWSKVDYFLTKQEQEKLPPWQELNPRTAAAGKIVPEMVNLETDVPF